MTVAEIKTHLSAEIVCGEQNAELEVHNACGSDMMSDVLAFVKEQSVLLTGLVNTQVIRTADMMDMVCIVFVRGKEPTEEMVRLAEERGIVLLKSPLRMFSACGILYNQGLRGGVDEKQR
jgi:serine kinase of HPr protein (carbohydrate metabolism regulator)